MREMTDSEIKNVEGGILPYLLGGLAFVYYERQNIRDFVDGFFEGLDPEH